MVRIVMLAGFGLCVFVASAVATWFLQNNAGQKNGKPAAATADAAGEEPAPDHPEPAAGKTPPGAVTPAAQTATGLPVAVRPRPMSIEELLRFGMGLNQREEARQREEDMREQALHVKLVLADLRGEQEAIDGLRSQVQSQLEAADKLLGKLEAARNAFAEERAKAEQDLKTAQSGAQIQIDDLQHRENIKQTATWLQAMEPDKAADVLREMANDGRLEHGVKILAQLEERDVAKILSALDDAKLVDQFIVRFQDLKRPPARSASRR